MFIETTVFTRIFDQLVKDRKLKEADFDDFEEELLQNPQIGKVISGMEGLRKVRLKSAGKGKRGGFRVDYLDFPDAEITYFVVIYPKNVKEDLTSEEKQVILKMIKLIKKGVQNG
jgi:hypothetical protein